MTKLTILLLISFLGYNISKCEMTEEAILNSPRILELHEVLQPSEVDIVKFYFHEVCKSKIK